MSIVFRYFVVLAVLVSGCYSYVAEMTEERGDISQAMDPEANSYQNRRAQANVHSTKTSHRRRSLENDGSGKKEPESLILSIDTGAEPENTRRRNDDNEASDIIDKIASALKDMSTKADYRKYGLKPEYVNLKEAGKPSLKLEINSKNIMRALENLLASPLTRRYADIAAKHAAAYYKAIVDEVKGTARRNRDT